MADNPIMNVRVVATTRQPVRAVLDTDFRIAEDANLFNGDPVWIFTARPDAAKIDRLSRRNARVIRLPQDAAGGLDLGALMDWLGAHEINEVHVEAGARLNDALVAGHGLAGNSGAFDDLSEAPRYEFVDAVQLGRDMRLRLRDQARWQALCAVLEA